MQHNSSQNDTNTYPQRHMIPHHQNELFLSIRTSPDTQPWPATTDKSGYSHDSQNRIMSGNTDTHCILQLSIIDNTRDTTMSGDSPRRSCFVRMSCLIKHRILVTATLSYHLVSSPSIAAVVVPVSVVDCCRYFSCCSFCLFQLTVGTNNQTTCWRLGV